MSAAESEPLENHELDAKLCQVLGDSHVVGMVVRDDQITHVGEWHVLTLETREELVQGACPTRVDKQRATHEIAPRLTAAQLANLARHASYLPLI